MKKVPFVDLQRQYGPIRAELHESACRVIDDGGYIGGPEVKGFEEEMSRWLGRDIRSTSCATMGLFACLKALGVGPGDEVITTVHTAIPTVEAISLTGAKVVFCDIGAGSFNLDVEQVAASITPRTRAIIPVHLYGTPADMKSILATAARHGLPVIEDCAQAQGARYEGQLVGTLADAAAFSFFPSKNLGGFGDGGAVAARDPERLRWMRKFCNHGREDKYLHEFEGINSRLDALQAALLRICLRRLDTWNSQRREAAAWYDERLAGVPEVLTPAIPAGTTPVYHVYVVVVPDREALAAHLKSKGIATGVHYPMALNRQPAYERQGFKPGQFPRAEKACAHMLSLPMFPGLLRDEADYVAECIREFYR